MAGRECHAMPCRAVPCHAMRGDAIPRQSTVKVRCAECEGGAETFEGELELDLDLESESASESK
jgi:hypothetical protein